MSKPAASAAEARAERALVPFATDDDAVLAVFDAMCDTIEGDYSIDDARAILAALDRYLTGEQEER